VPSAPYYTVHRRVQSQVLAGALLADTNVAVLGFPFAIMGPVSGVGSKTFTISARPGMAAWLGCIGTDLVSIKSPLAFAVICGNGGGFMGA
jgi:hypothetical protein